MGDTEKRLVRLFRRARVLDMQALATIQELSLQSVKRLCESSRHASLVGKPGDCCRRELVLSRREEKAKSDRRARSIRPLLYRAQVR